jgi:hypothetical protein
MIAKRGDPFVPVSTLPGARKQTDRIVLKAPDQRRTLAHREGQRKPA